jgi:hypothetical protein
VAVRPTQASFKRWYGRGTRVASRVYSAAGAAPQSDLDSLLVALHAHGVPSIQFSEGRSAIVLVPDEARAVVAEILRSSRLLISDQWGGQVPARFLSGRLPASRSTTWDLRTGSGTPAIARIEFWIARADRWFPPNESRIARPVASPSVGGDVRQLGSLTPDARATTMPIDVVYTWVDGSDPAWLERRRPFAPSHDRVDASSSRYHDRDELRYSLRSVRSFAPWVRRIFLVTDQQRPTWLTGDEITVVDHRELFPDPDVLPTFNSHAIETVLHRIPGLSEHFVYFNDDVLVGRPIQPELFFSPGGLARLSFSRTPIDYLSVEPYARAWRSMADLVEQRFGARPLQVLRHTPHPMVRSEMEWLEGQFPEEFARIRSQRFRGDGDLPPVALSRYTMLQRGAAFERPFAYDYINLSAPDATARLKALPATARRVDTLCLNDTSGQAPPDDVVVAALRAAFPAAAPWEARA